MIRVCFICHGNICRSTMAQFVFQDMVNKRGLSDQFTIDSKATSTEELGNPPHRGTVRKLAQVGVPVLPHRASQLSRSDYDKFDYIIGMVFESYYDKTVPVDSLFGSGCIDFYSLPEPLLAGGS